MEGVQEFFSRDRKYSSYFTGAGIIVGLLMVLLGIASYVGFLFYGIEKLKPSDLNAGFLLSVGATIIITVLSPLLKAEETRQRDEEDATAAYKDLATEYLALKSSVPSAEGKTDQDKALKALLIEFLEKWDSWGFNIKRIVEWGSKRSGFEALAGYSPDEIHMALVTLVAEGKVRTRLSKKGSTLYQAN